MNNSVIQGSVFEEDYLIRQHASLVYSSDIALTELVANAWDAGATEVEITIPEEIFGEILIRDNGIGMTEDEFTKRWMMLGYNRIKSQGEMVQFPPDVNPTYRRAYGRNGVGRHGMLCFAQEYCVETTKDGMCNKFFVTVSAGQQAFVVVAKTSESAEGHGTTLRAKLERNFPDINQVREIISARFLFDPSFQVRINGTILDFTEHKLIDNRTIKVNETIMLDITIIDSTKAARTIRQQGVAFWVGNRLVGEPTWTLGDISLADGRTNFARRHTVVVKTNDLFDNVLPDWSAFRKSTQMDEVYKAVAKYVDGFYRNSMSEKLGETKRTVVLEHRGELEQLPVLGQVEVSNFIEELTENQPTIQPEMLSAAVHAVIQLEKTRSGASLLHKLSVLSEEDIDGLNRLLDDWTVKDALTVLDEIDKRLMVVEALARFSADSSTYELKTLHPLVVQARWLFGPEFDSPHYTSNISLTNAMYELFGKKVGKEVFINHRNRPDIIIMEDSSISAICSEEFEENSHLSTINRILIIELKRGGAEIGRTELTQANNYVDDLLNSGHLDGTPYIHSFVVGHRLDNRINNSRVRKVGEPERGRVEAVSYGQLVRTARQRLFKLRDQLKMRYEQIADETLVQEVLQEPLQLEAFQEISTV